MKKLIPLVLLIVFFVAAAWWSLTRSPDPIHDTTPPSLSLEPVAEEPEPVVPLTEIVQVEELAFETEPLPALHESDESVAGVLSELAGEDAPLQYLVKDQVISRLVAVIDSLDARQVPQQVNPFRRPGGGFIVDTDGGRAFIGVENAARYEGHIALLRQLDAPSLAAAYHHYYPLLQQAWQDNGGEGPFHARLLGLIDHLSATPDVAGDIEVVKPEAVYLYADPGLEALSAGQKILLRMGPDNASLVKARLEEVKALIGK